MSGGETKPAGKILQQELLENGGFLMPDWDVNVPVIKDDMKCRAKPLPHFTTEGAACRLGNVEEKEQRLSVELVILEIGRVLRVEQLQERQQFTPVSISFNFASGMKIVKIATRVPLQDKISRARFAILPLSLKGRLTPHLPSTGNVS